MSDVVNELSDLDQAVQACRHRIDDLPVPVAAAALIAANQLAANARALAGDLEEHVADHAEPGTWQYGDLTLTIADRPNRTGWDNDAIEAELRRRVVFDEGGDERSGSAVWDRLTRLLPIRGYQLAGSRSGAERLAAALDLDSARDLDEFCEVRFRRVVRAEERQDVDR